MSDTPIPDPPPATDPPPVADWPEHSYDPASPQFPEQAGTRIRVLAHVAIFDLQAGEEAEVFDQPEVHAAADNGLVTIL